MTDEAEHKHCQDLAIACVRHDGDDACHELDCDICDRDVARITALLVRERAAVRDAAPAEVERLKAAQAWQPIATVPAYEQVLLWAPNRLGEHFVASAAEWEGEVGLMWMPLPKGPTP